MRQSPVCLLLFLLNIPLCAQDHLVLPLTQTNPVTAKHLPAEILVTEQLIRDVARQTDAHPDLVKVILHQLSGGTDTLNTAKMQSMAKEFQRNGVLSKDSLAGMDTASIVNLMGSTGYKTPAAPLGNRSMVPANGQQPLGAVLNRLLGTQGNLPPPKLGSLLNTNPKAATAKTNSMSASHTSKHSAIAHLLKEQKAKEGASAKDNSIEDN
ncbi:MAG: hypothetical protein AAGA18_00435 [Verrucomicrobiota bacterium]